MILLKYSFGVILTFTDEAGCPFSFQVAFNITTSNDPNLHMPACKYDDKFEQSSSIVPAFQYCHQADTRKSHDMTLNTICRAGPYARGT